MATAPFFYHPRMLAYDFGRAHPLRPERLRRAAEILGALGIESMDPGPGERADLLLSHSQEYVDAVERVEQLDRVTASGYGLGTADNPIFPDMYAASLAYCAGSAAAARAVAHGARLAFNLSGGLHHAMRARASGFCVFNDCAIALSILKEAFGRVAYVDIDVHHGDGVQAIFCDDPNVLTCSIHESGKTLFPGTGFIEETGPCFTSLNVPLAAGTTGDTFMWAFEQAVIPALKRFAPRALVLQMGADAHETDPLAHLCLQVQDWLAAIKMVAELGLPTVALGGGGYNLDNVPRMWVAATLVLLERPVPEHLPASFDPSGRIQTFDLGEPPPQAGYAEAARVVERLEYQVLAHIPIPERSPCGS